MVQSPTTTLVVDTTPDFRYQMLRSKTHELHAILYTHPHKDHIAGLDDVRAYNFFQRKPMDIFCNQLTEDGLRKEFSYVFNPNKYPGIPELNIHSIDEHSEFMVGDIPVKVIQVWHLRLPVLGFRFGAFTYITDANRIEEVELQKIKGSEGLVINALRHEKHISHFTLNEATEIAQKVKAEKTYFTHISHQLGLHKEVEKELPAKMHLAYDGLQLEFSETEF